LKVAVVEVEVAVNDQSCDGEPAGVVFALGQRVLVDDGSAGNLGRAQCPGALLACRGWYLPVAGGRLRAAAWPPRGSVELYWGRVGEGQLDGGRGESGVALQVKVVPYSPPAVRVDEPVRVIPPSLRTRPVAVTVPAMLTAPGWPPVAQIAADDGCGVMVSALAAPEPRPVAVIGPTSRGACDDTSDDDQRRPVGSSDLVTK
jgi:hypothetical protein